MTERGEPLAPAAPGKRRPTRLRRLLGLGGYLAFLVLVLEAGLQAFYWATTGSVLFSRASQPIFVADPHCGWAVQPNLRYQHRTPEFSVAVHTNSQGLRVSPAHEEYAIGRDDSRYRILLLGPSFAFGWGVNYEDSFAALLQKRLTDAGFAGGRTIEVINHGVPNLPPANNLNWFRQVGRAYGPDLVIQFMYGSMAVSGRPEQRQIRGGYLVSADATLRQRAAALAKNSAIVFYGWTIATKLRSASGPGDGRIEGAGRELTVARQFDPHDPEVAEALAFYEDLRHAVDSAGARLLVLYFPLSYAVHPQDMSRWRHLGVRNVQAQQEFDRAFAGCLEQRGICTVDVTPALLEAASASNQRLYYWLDVHWTPAGNAVVAEALAKFLLADPTWAQRPALAGRAPERTEGPQAP